MSPTLAARRARRVLYASLAVGIVLLVMGLGYMLAATLTLTQAVRHSQINGTPTGDKLLAASDRILDCTSPEGDCFKASQARTAKAVGDINQVIVLAAACSAGLPEHLTVPQRQARISTCVIHRLALSRNDR